MADYETMQAGLARELQVAITLDPGLRYQLLPTQKTKKVQKIQKV
jgi:hypothetical protein